MKKKIDPKKLTIKKDGETYRWPKDLKWSKKAPILSTKHDDLGYGDYQRWVVGEYLGMVVKPNSPLKEMIYLLTVKSKNTETKLKEVESKFNQIRWLIIVIFIIELIKIFIL